MLRNSEHPPIMKGTSWTLAAPFKEQKYHRTPSESIANNYTPSASDLKLKDLPKITRGRTKSKCTCSQRSNVIFYESLTLTVPTLKINEFAYSEDPDEEAHYESPHLD